MTALMFVNIVGINNKKATYRRHMGLRSFFAFYHIKRISNLQQLSPISVLSNSMRMPDGL